MSFDPEKNASRIHLAVSTARNSGYTGNDLLRIVKALLANVSISEAELASSLGLDGGYNNSGIGDLKRLALTIIELARADTPSALREDQ